MSDQLTQYFERYAEAAITKMKAALIAVDYYGDVPNSVAGLSRWS